MSVDSRAFRSLLEDIEVALGCKCVVRREGGSEGVKKFWLPMFGRYVEFSRLVGFSELEKRVIFRVMEVYKKMNPEEASGIDKDYLNSLVVNNAMDVAIATFLSGSQNFINIFSLIQCMKTLSYERYEGESVRAGVVVRRGNSPLGDYENYDFDAKFVSFILKDKKNKLKTIRISEKVVKDTSFFRYVDGVDSFFVCDTNLDVVGYYNVVANRKNVFDRLTGQSVIEVMDNVRDCLFYICVNSSSEVEIFKSNKSRFVYRKGKWRIFDNRVIDGCFGVSNDFSPWKMMYSLSKIRRGTVFVVTRNLGKIKKDGFIKKHIDGGNGVLDVILKNMKKKSVIDVCDSGELMRILTTDGMTLIKKGFTKLLDVNVIVNTSKSPKGEIGGGGRSTAALAASVYGVSAKVSEDGPISIFKNGKCIYSVG
ncbi:hypothetical protein N1030_07140 [Desulfovibrio mangrovi]|uniref:hypothetical protein n=1 Tax=Desulfovibrio mangrovi TaxID=2976983 RepID=UPI0022464D79|nr:hypothetical protein [Desulfovibrio mangrovi]UZP68738.1 hypothetical protein N1030_07140 [Desulfovibrio mangrovi]